MDKKVKWIIGGIIGVGALMSLTNFKAYNLNWGAVIFTVVVVAGMIYVAKKGK